MYKKVLVAVDGSDSSQGVIQLVKDLVKNGVIESITLISVAVVPTLPMEFVIDDHYNLEMVASAVLNKVKANLEDDGLIVGAVVVNGDPGVAISQYAQDNGFDLIILGSRGLSGVKGVVLGSVSHKVLHTAQCPVWIYKS